MYATDNSGTATTTSISKTQLTGLASGTISVVKSTDIAGNETVSTTTLNRSNKTVTQTTDTPESSTNSVTVKVNGLVTSQTTSSNLSYSYAYDGLGRQTGVTDPRTGQSTTAYYSSGAGKKGKVQSVTDAASNTTTFDYSSSTGRKISEENALGKKTYYNYNSRNQVLALWGDVPYPTEYSYDSYGRMSTLNTYRGTSADFTQSAWPSSPGTADTTTWTYQEATGLLTAKTYADNKSVSYTYTADGKLATRTWARLDGSNPLVTSYSYDTAADLTGIAYSDSTPAVGFTYNRLGQQKTVADAVGSRTFGYNSTLQLTSETINGIYNKVISRSYDTLGRSSGMNIGTEYDVDYGYDTYGRFSTVTNGNDTFTYSYLANSNLIQFITYPSTISVTKSYESNRDLVTSVENKYGQTTISKYDYSNDDLGRRTAMGKSGTAFSQADTISYGYNDKSEVTSAVAQNRTTFNYLYNFDNLGNRRTSTSSETGTPVQTAYTANSLNQYSLINDGNAKTPAYDFDGNMTSDGGNWT